MEKLTLGSNYIECRDACGKCATNTFRVSNKLGYALFDMEESPYSKSTLETISRRFSRTNIEEIKLLHTAVQNIIARYKADAK